MYENKEYPGKNYNDLADWVFGAEIANRFTDEAEKHIPDYWKVIELTINILKDKNLKMGISLMWDVLAVIHYCIYPNKVSKICLG
ncbi:hypothetical protein [Dapis sp. BLCC M172]|uniref:hypothetical protein n=1 Tax=Dapis sp. BLCC M172 TaxID=2975281 RepID=UPI003CFA1661